VTGDRAGWLLLAASYLLGSIPFGLLLGRLVAGVDVRQSGSGNIGATNVARAAGRRLGVATLLLDAAKGGIPVGVTALLLGDHHDAGWPAAAGLAAFLGHVFPPWLRFRGGKGVATAFGAFVVLSPWLALLAAVAFGAVFAVTKVVSASSMLAAAALAGGAAVFHGRDAAVTRVAVVVLVVVVLRHHANIRRMLRGDEKRLVAATRSGPRSPRPPGG
jgi:acyl phosphate:glycerol-3-phosphate acyltransferase